MDDEVPIHGRDIILTTQTEGLQRINECHPAYDALQYPILFPRGEIGWHPDIPYTGADVDTSRKRVTIRQYTSYRIQMRHQHANVLHKGGRLFQQYIVDMFCKMEQNVLKWVRSNQQTIRSELYQVRRYVLAY